MIEKLNIMVAEKATCDFFGCDGLLNAIIVEVPRKEVKNKMIPTLSDGIFPGLGEWDLKEVQPKLAKVTMTHYTFEDFDGKQKAYINDGRRQGLMEVIRFSDEELAGFLHFQKSQHRNISWEQSAAVYWAKQKPDYCLVSESDMVLDLARSNGVTTMSIEEMRSMFFETSDAGIACEPRAQPCAVCPFDPRVDEEKVVAAFHSFIENDEGMVLKSKSYWIVVCVLFEWYEWLSLRKRSGFREWVNAHFHFNSPLSENDFKSASQKIIVDEKDLSKWPNNKYRDLAYTIKQIFFGERRGLPNGYYVYANEPQYLKAGKQIRHRNE